MELKQQYLNELWDRFAFEFYKARVAENSYWQPHTLAQKSYEYADHMMKERETCIQFRQDQKKLTF